MIITSSFTFRMADRVEELCSSLKDKISGARAIFYYEELPGEPFRQELARKYPWVEWISLVKKDRNGLRKVDSFPQFEAARKSPSRNTRYWNFHARFWFRKTAAVRACCLSNPGEQAIIWVDADCILRRSLLTDALHISKNGDIGYIKRINKPTDTGIIFFGIGNPMVRRFIERWYSIYTSGDVFSLKHWADHQVFDHLMTLPEFKTIKFFDLCKCPPAKGLIRHCMGHREMTKMRLRS